VNKAATAAEIGVSLSTSRISVEKLQSSLQAKAKSEPSYRFYSLWDKVYREDVLLEAFRRSRANTGAPGVDGIDFEAIEAAGVERWLKALQEELRGKSYAPQPLLRVWIPKRNGGQRPLSIPTVKDRVVQTAVVLVLGPIFEADLAPQQYGFRPGLDAKMAVRRVYFHITEHDRREVVDADLSDYFDSVRHDLLLAKVAQRVSDAEVLHLLKLMLKSTGKLGVPQGGVISPLLSNIYLNEVDKMLERAKEATRAGQYTYVEYARYADDLVILIDAYKRHDWLLTAVMKRLREEFAKLQVEINEEKSRIVDLGRGESFGFLGFDFRRTLSRRGVWRAQYTPKLKKRTALLRKLKEIFRRFQSQPLDGVVELINPVLRGWVRYFAIGHSSSCFSFIKDWVEKKARRHLGRASKRRGFGWNRWSRRWLYETVGLFNGYRVQVRPPKVLPA
jgi:RNA-directed DNA polymerase